MPLLTMKFAGLHVRKIRVATFQYGCQKVNLGGAAFALARSEALKSSPPHCAMVVLLVVPLTATTSVMPPLETTVPIAKPYTCLCTGTADDRTAGRARGILHTAGTDSYAVDCNVVAEAATGNHRFPMPPETHDPRTSYRQM